MSGVEYSLGRRGAGTFPESWGPAPERAEARQSWIATRVRQEQLRKLQHPEEEARKRRWRHQDAQLANIRDTVDDLHRRHG